MLRFSEFLTDPSSTLSRVFQLQAASSTAEFSSPVRKCPKSPTQSSFPRRYFRLELRNVSLNHFQAQNLKIKIPAKKIPPAEVSIFVFR